MVWSADWRNTAELGVTVYQSVAVTSQLHHRRRLPSTCVWISAPVIWTKIHSPKIQDHTEQLCPCCCFPFESVVMHFEAYLIYLFRPIYLEWFLKYIYCPLYCILSYVLLVNMSTHVLSVLYCVNLSLSLSPSRHCRANLPMGTNKS